MVRSMTGYGEAEREVPAGLLRLEVKTVNHRFFNTSVKTPPGYDKFEKVLTDVLKERIGRGHVNVYLTVDRSKALADGAVRVDLERARQIRDALRALGDELGVDGPVDLAMLARFGELFRAPEQERTEGVDTDTIRDIAAEAASAVVALREAEGLRLAADMRGRLDAMAAALDRIEARAPERLLAERDRLKAAVRELSEQIETDADRLAREIAYLAEKWDINEELVRFRSHLDLFRDALESGPEEPVGKRLGFLVQEMNREANTIASKANDATISQEAVALKEEIERLREQVENVE